MLVLLDNAQDLDQCAEELGGASVGQLLTPITFRKLRDPAKPWAIDNGLYSEVDMRSFMSLLAREFHHRENCLFVAAPDVVGSARRTLELFEHFRHPLREWKLALVCQDGQEDLPIPWEHIAAVFIGGTTKWKCSAYPAQIIQAAKTLDKWVHAGRVNQPGRFKHFEALGCDSCDGTGLARYTHMREAIADRHNQGDFLNDCV